MLHHRLESSVRSTLALRAQQRQNHHRSPLPQPHQPCDLARIVIALSRSCPSYCTCNCSLRLCVFVVSPSCIFKDSTLSASNVTIPRCSRSCLPDSRVNADSHIARAPIPFTVRTLYLSAYLFCPSRLPSSPWDDLLILALNPSTVPLCVTCWSQYANGSVLPLRRSSGVRRSAAAVVESYDTATFHDRYVDWGPLAMTGCQLRLGLR